MPSIIPNLSILPPAQRALWPELDATPSTFTLYGGTALALRLGHRTSVDFDFFSFQPFDGQELCASLPYLQGAEIVQAAPQTLTCRVDRGAPVLISFFGNLSHGVAAPKEQIEGTKLFTASLLDLAATKLSVVQKRAEAKDYVDIDAILTHGLSLSEAIKAAHAVYGSGFNPCATLKALCYFGDVPDLEETVQTRLRTAVKDFYPALFGTEGTE